MDILSDINAGPLKLSAMVRGAHSSLSWGLYCKNGITETLYAYLLPSCLVEVAWLRNRGTTVASLPQLPACQGLSGLS
jgi:hypothetical protein